MRGNFFFFLFVKKKLRDYRIDRLFKEGLHLEHTMWTLSTFGGAFSAMADFAEEYVCF